MRRACAITIFPEMFRAITECGMTRRALETGALALELVNPRDFADNAYRRVDDRPYGGGPGMIMMAEPLDAAIEHARERVPGATVTYLSPQGRTLDQARVRQIADGEDRILLCGRYEGVDERVIERQVDEEISVGDYVLAGGELAAMVLIESVARLLPGVLGNADSAQQDSFSDGLLDCGHYTRPEKWRGMAVPEVLLGGNHEEIRRWRLKDALRRTRARRPDLLRNVARDEEARLILEQLDEESIQSEQR
jgi:tRNA (guanine37-N1)-methyltransferase